MRKVNAPSKLCADKRPYPGMADKSLRNWCSGLALIATESIKSSLQRGVHVRGKKIERRRSINIGVKVRAQHSAPLPSLHQLRGQLKQGPRCPSTISGHQDQTGHRSFQFIFSKQFISSAFKTGLPSALPLINGF